MIGVLNTEMSAQTTVDTKMENDVFYVSIDNGDWIAKDDVTASQWIAIRPILRAQQVASNSNNSGTNNTQTFTNSRNTNGMRTNADIEALKQNVKTSTIEGGGNE